MPCGVVFLRQPEMTDEIVRRHFRQIRRLGFNCLKGLYVPPGQDRAHTERLAVDEGLVPWWYGEAGWEAPGPGESRDCLIYRNRQRQLMLERIDRGKGGDLVASEGRPRFPFSFDHVLDEASSEHFTGWLTRTYGTVAALAKAWNFDLPLIRRPEPMWLSWADVARGVVGLLRGETVEYRRIRDVLRYKADVYLEMVRERAASVAAADSLVPARAGGEMGLFLPFAARATDMEGVAEAMREYGSFYPSIHLAWHFEEVGFEVARPVYMQASLAADWAKGVWSATWESTGGPQQLSGGKAHLYPAAAPHTAGFTVDGPRMRQLLLSYLAAGFRGFGLWCWNGRRAGWEAGEYALCDRQDRPTERAVEAGKVARALNRYRDELWAARKEPLIRVLQDFDNEAMWAAIGVGGRDHFRHVPMQARVGVSRALINGNVPWCHVTPRQLARESAGAVEHDEADEAGEPVGAPGREMSGGEVSGREAPGREVLYLPAFIALSAPLLAELRRRAEAGARIVIDLPGAWYDEYGRLLDTGRGSDFEQLFGVTIRDMQYSARDRVRVPEDGSGELTGFTADLEPTTAKAQLSCARTGLPLVTEHSVGTMGGSAVVLGFEAGRACFEPGRAGAEARLLHWALSDLRSPYACQGAIAYRLSAPGADHYVLVNESESDVTAQLRPALACAGAVAVLEDEPVDLERIAIAAGSAVWVRCAHG